MERNDIKKAVDRNEHVIYNGVEYYVKGYTYWSNKLESGESLILHDLNANSVIQAPVSDVERLPVYKRRDTV